MEHLISLLPEWSQEWASKRMSVLDTLPDEDYARSIGDWLSWLEIHKPKMVNKLYKLNWEQAVTAHTKWLQAREKRLKTHIHNIEGDANAVEEILTSGKYTWKRINSLAGLDFEGNAMGHCIGQNSYYKNLHKKQAEYYTLRDEYNIPHLTVEYDLSDMKITQVRCKGNAPVSEKYCEHFFKLVDYIDPAEIALSGLVDNEWKQYFILRTDNDVKIFEDSTDKNFHKNLYMNIGKIEKEVTGYGRFHLLKHVNIPKNFRIKGRLYVSCCPDFTTDINLQYDSLSVVDTRLKKDYYRENIKNLYIIHVDNINYIQNCARNKLMVANSEITGIRKCEPDIAFLSNNPTLCDLSELRPKKILQIENCPDVSSIDDQNCSDFIMLACNNNIQVNKLQAPHVIINSHKFDFSETEIISDKLDILNSYITTLKEVNTTADRISLEFCHYINFNVDEDPMDKILLKNCGVYKNNLTHITILDDNTIKVVPYKDISGRVLGDINIRQHPVFSIEYPDKLENIQVNGDIYIENWNLECLKNISCKGNIHLSNSTIENIENIQCNNLFINNLKCKNLTGLKTDGFLVKNSDINLISETDIISVHMINNEIEALDVPEKMRSAIICGINNTTNKTFTCNDFNADYMVMKDISGHKSIYKAGNNLTDMDGNMELRI